MNNSEKIIIVVGFLLMSFVVGVIISHLGQARKVDCELYSPPEYFFEEGDKVKIKSSGEEVRVVNKWYPLNSTCGDRSVSSYIVRFDDGAEVTKEWDQLSKL